jgi:hypothetical protein
VSEGERDEGRSEKTDHLLSNKALDAQPSNKGEIQKRR